MRLIGIGDNVCDVYLHLAEMFPGGQALNVAVFAKMQGIDSAYLGVFGDDEVAEHIEKRRDPRRRGPRHRHAPCGTS